MCRNKIAIFFIFFYFSIACKAQTSNVWPFGFKTALYFKPDGNTLIGKSHITWGVRVTDFQTMVSSAIGDCNANILLYSSESSIWNKYDSAILGGELLGLGGTNHNGDKASLLLPIPKSNKYYYLFHTGIVLNPGRLRLMATLIDISSNNGNGQVVFKDSMFAGETPASRNLTFANHKNGRDIWLITTPDESHVKAYLIDSTGLHTTPVVSDVFNEMARFPEPNGYLYSDTHVNDALGAGIVFSKDQKTLITYGVFKKTTSLGNVLMYDFDNSTRTFTFNKTLFSQSQKPANCFSSAACFSPNDSIIYVYFAANDVVPGYYSYLYAANRYTNAKVLIRRFPYNFKGKSVIGRHEWMINLTLAPDNRIYSFMGTDIWRIERPNKWGTGCMYRFWDTIPSPVNTVGIIEGLPRVYGKIKSTYFETISQLKNNPCQDSTRIIYKGEGDFKYIKIDWGDQSVDSILGKNVDFGKQWKHLYATDGNYAISIGGETNGCGGYFTYTDTIEVKRNPVKISLTLNELQRSCRSDSFLLNWKYSSATNIQLMYGKDSLGIAYSSADTSVKLNFLDTGTQRVFLSATAKNNCYIHDTLLTIVHFLPPPKYKIYFDSTICQKASIHIKIRDIYNSDSLHILDKNTKVLFTEDSIDYSINGTKYGKLPFSIITYSHLGCIDTALYSCDVKPAPSIGIFTNEAAQQCSNIAQWTIERKLDSSQVGFNAHWNWPKVGDLKMLKDSTILNWNCPIPGNYTFSCTQTFDNGCSDNQALLLSILPNPNISMVVLDTACSNQPLTIKLKDNIMSLKTIESSGLFDTVSFNKYSLDTVAIIGVYPKSGNFTISYIAVSAAGCESVLKSAVYIKPADKALVSTNNNKQCFNGNEVVLNDKFLDNIEVNWGDGNITTDTLRHVYKNSGSFHLTVIHQSKNNCFDTTELKIQILQNPNINVSHAAACLGKPTEFFSTVSKGATAIKGIYWYSSGFVDTTGPTASYIFSQTGNTHVTSIVVDSAECADTFLSSFNVLDTPAVAMTLTPQWATNLELFYDFHAAPDSMKTYSWKIKSTDKTGQNFQFVFPNDPQNYIIQLRVISPSGCESQLMDTLKTMGTTGFYFPNAISINHDGLNESFGIAGPEYIKEYELKIYNRWGSKVFETTNPNELWKPSADLPGLYIYYCKVTDIYNRKQTIKSTILVME